MGPHPAVAEVRSAVRRALTALPLEQPLLVACSGGADSLAVAAATVFEAERAGRPVPGLITVDHGLQPGSAGQAARVLEQASSLGLAPVLAVRVEVGPAGGPEGAARAARYRALDAAAADRGAVVLLGHTLDDQAETVVLGLGRGSGARSLAGMPAARGPYLRPLLGVRRSTTRAACTALGLDAWDDPHNTDPAYRRVRVRTQVLPLLEDVLAGGVAQALARTARLVADDAAALDEWATRELAAAAVGGSLDAARIADLPRAVRSRVVRAWLAAQPSVGALTAERTDAVEQLITGWHGQAGVDLPGGAVVRRAGARLTVEPRHAPPGAV